MSETRSGASGDAKWQIQFADRWLSKHSPITNAPFPLRSYLVQFITKPKVHILDAGTGTIPYVGDQHPNAHITLTSCDMLANEYRQLLIKHGITLPKYVEYQDIEHLTYANDSFDIVHCSNALDHTADPYAAIQEFVRVCKPDGIVYLRHFRCVAIKERYTGLHRWNIHDLPDGDCKFWSATHEFLLSSCIPGFTTKHMVDFPEAGRKHGAAVVSIYRKKS